MKQLLIFLSLLIYNSNIAQEKYQFNGAISNETFYFDFALYTIGTPIDHDALKKDFFQTFPDLKQLELVPDVITEDAAAVFYYENAQSDYPAMALEYLQYFATGLSDRQKQLLAKSNQAIVFSMYGLKKNVSAINKRLTIWLEKIVQDQGWIIFDATTMEYFTQSDWANRVQSWETAIPYLPAHITIHSYREGAYCRAITLGMQKFCLPDIVVNQTSCHDTDATMNLINVVAQHLSRNSSIYKDQVLIDLDKISNKTFRKEIHAKLEDNAKKKVLLHLKKGKQEEGDPFNQIVEIDFENSAFDTPQLYHEQVLSDLFGFKEQLKSLEGHDNAILEASAKARERLPALQDLFNEEQKMSEGYVILLKAPFEDDKGNNEWMWVEVTQWDSSTIKGILKNEPFYIKSLKAGAKVVVQEEDIFDYILYKPDGTKEGNETQALILKAKGN